MAMVAQVCCSAGLLLWLPVPLLLLLSQPPLLLQMLLDLACLQEERQQLSLHSVWSDLVRELSLWQARHGGGCAKPWQACTSRKHRHLPTLAPS